MKAEIVVIQCAARKRAHGGYMRTREGALVEFVGDPKLAPGQPGRIVARPDDVSDTGVTWREVLWQANQERDRNALRLLNAFELYEPPEYVGLVRRFGLSNVYILSAGWGLIRADFLTPQYDITFSNRAEPYKRRRESDVYNDFRMLPEQDRGTMFFLGGKSYARLFCDLTAEYGGQRVIVYNSGSPPDLPEGMSVLRHNTNRRTNWHYEFARLLIEGEHAKQD